MTRVRDVCDDEDEDEVDEEKGCLGCPIVALEVWSNLVPTWGIYLGGMSYPSGPPLAL
jgi:hypothetical protein